MQVIFNSKIASLNSSIKYLNAASLLPKLQQLIIYSDKEHIEY